MPWKLHSLCSGILLAAPMLCGTDGSFTRPSLAANHLKGDGNNAASGMIGM